MFRLTIELTYTLLDLWVHTLCTLLYGFYGTHIWNSHCLLETNNILKYFSKLSMGYLEHTYRF